MQILAILLGLLVGAGTLALLFRPFFGSADRFFECMKFAFMPDLISLFRGEWTRDVVSSFILSAWLFLGLGAGFGVAIGVLALAGGS